MSAQLQVTGEAKIRDLQGPVVANSGVITALDGAASQYVRGDGTLADFPTATGGGSSVSYYLNGSVNQGTFGGSTYYQMSKNAITGAGTNFSTSSNGLLAQFITDANDPDQTSIPSGNWNIEFFMGVSASSGALASFYVEFYKYDGSTFTLIATNVATPEFLTGTTTVDAYFTSVAFAETPLATTDRLAIRIYANVASKTVTLYTEDNRLCQVVTTFSRGILSLNNLTDQQQYFSVGTSGTDFNIVSSLDTHTFNIPVASATNTGKLSSTDWSTFNNKQPAGNYVTLDTTQTITGEKTFSGDTTSITSSYFNLDGITGSTGNALNIKQYATNLVTGVGYSSIGAIDTTKFSFYLGNTSAFDSRIFVLDASNLTINTTKTYTLPNITGTLALLEGTQTFLGDKTFDGISSFNATIFNAQQNNFNYGFQVAKQNTTAIQSGYMTISSVAGTASTLKISDGNSSTNTIFTFDTTGSRTYTFPASSGTIALTSNLSSYVPYIGATSNINLGLQTILAGQLISGYESGTPGSINPGSVLMYHPGTSSAVGVRENSTLIYPGSATTLRFRFFQSTTSNEYQFIFNAASLTLNTPRTYTLPDASGTLALTSSIPSVSGTSGQVTYFNGTSSVTGSNNHFWDATNNRLGIGTNNPQRSLEIYSATADSHLRLSGSAPSVSMGEAVTGSVYQAKFGLATASGQYVSGAVAGDFIMLSQTGATIFATSATEKARITSGGNLLLGTTSDNGAKLQVSGSATFTSSVTSTSAYSNTSDLGFIASANIPGINLRSSGGGRLSIVTGYIGADISSILVGTGTNNPTTEAIRFNHSANSINVFGAATFSSSVTANYGGTFIIPSESPVTGNVALIAKTSNGNNDIFRWYDGTTQLGVFKNSGNVGIGTSSITNGTSFGGGGQVNRLKVASGNYTCLEINGNTSGGSIQFTYGTDAPNQLAGLIGYNYASGSANEFVISNVLNGPMVFATNNAERMRITSGGNVLIGTTSDGGNKLSVVGTIRSTQLRAGEGGIAAGNYTIYSNDDNVGYIDTIRAVNSGDFQFRFDGTSRATINRSTGAYVATSDINKKKDFELSNLGLKEILSLKPTLYRMKIEDESEKKHLGFIAQEVKEYIPQAYVEKNDFIGLDFNPIVATLVKAIQEQQQMIEELKELIKNK